MQLSRWRKAGTRLCMGVMMAFALAACSDTPKPESELGGRQTPATPGSARDFAVNVGDIVYFTTDSVELSPEARQTLTNQARWLQQYSQYTITLEGHADERGTRIQHRPGREALTGCASFPGPARHQCPAYPHDLLWQGASGSGLQRHFLLVAKSPCPNRAQQPPRSAILADRTKVRPQCRRSLALDKAMPSGGARSHVAGEEVGRPPWPVRHFCF